MNMYLRTLNRDLNVLLDAKLIADRINDSGLRYSLDRGITTLEAQIAHAEKYQVNDTE
jgi:hypothetical protein